MIRDVLAGEIPVVLRSDFYATASLIGGIIYYALQIAGVNWFINFVITSLLVILIRLLAIRYHVQLPQAHVNKRNFRRLRRR